MAGEEGAAPAAGDAPPATPGYTSPTEQLLANLPFGGMFGLFDQLTRSSGGGSGGGSFKFSVSEMRELHRQFSDEVEALDTMAQKSLQSSDALKPLASDEASMTHYDAAKEHFGKLEAAVAQQRTFAKGFRDAIGAALGIKIEEEESISAGLGATKKAMG